MLLKCILRYPIFDTYNAKPNFSRIGNRGSTALLNFANGNLDKQISVNELLQILSILLNKTVSQ